MAAQQKIFIVWLQGQPGWIVDRYHAYTQRVVPKSSQMIYSAWMDRAGFEHLRQAWPCRLLHSGQPQRGRSSLLASPKNSCTRRKEKIELPKLTTEAALWPDTSKPLYVPSLAQVLSFIGWGPTEATPFSLRRAFQYTEYIRSTPSVPQ